MRAPFLPQPKPKHKRRVPTQKQRNAFSQTVRAQIRSRDGEICNECLSKKATQIHHVCPRSRGGRGVATNGLPLCHECHRSIHDNATLMNKWQEIYEQRYGPDYYKDEWDVLDSD